MTENNRVFKCGCLLFICGVVAMTSTIMLYTQWYFGEPRDFNENSWWAYTTKIPKSIKQLERVQLASEVTYDYKTADGLHPEIIVMRYQSSANIREFEQLMQPLLQSWGLSCTKKNAQYLRCERDYNFLDNPEEINYLYDGHYMVNLELEQHGEFLHVEYIFIS